ncbi:MAG: ferredoxin [Patescibacteria group bacterium]|jgi:ferredoxin
MAKATSKKVICNVKIDREVCIGCGNCAAICSEIFSLDKTGVSTVNLENITGEMSDSIIEVESNCPTGAISIEYASAEQVEKDEDR